MTSVSVKQQLRSFINDLTILGQNPLQWEYKNTFVRLKTFIIRQTGCENDAKTIKLTVSELFDAAIRTDEANPTPYKTAAFLTYEIRDVIPAAARDWTKSGQENNQGPSLFGKLLSDRASAFLRAPPLGRRSSEQVEQTDHPNIALLRPSERINLAAFIGCLADYRLLDFSVVYMPTHSDLEAVCRMLCAAHSIVMHSPWFGSVYNALEFVRHQMTETLDNSLRVLLLETIWKARMKDMGLSSELLKREYRTFVASSRALQGPNLTPPRSRLGDGWPTLEESSQLAASSSSNTPRNLRRRNGSRSEPAESGLQGNISASNRMISQVPNQQEDSAPNSKDNSSSIDCADIYKELMECLKHEIPDQESSIAPAHKVRSFEWTECNLCIANIGDYALVPCGHTGVCKECAEKLTICPICRTAIVTRMKIYKP